MAETYEIALTLQVGKISTKEMVISETVTFNDQPFSKMVNLADEFYTLTDKLQKVK